MRRCVRWTRQAIYLQDIDFATAGGVATAADVLVKQARTRVRVSRLKEGHAKVRTENEKYWYRL